MRNELISDHMIPESSASFCIRARSVGIEIPAMSSEGPFDTGLHSEPRFLTITN